MLFTSLSHSGRTGLDPVTSENTRQAIGSIMRWPVLLNKAGLLACNIPVILPMPPLATQWI